MKRYPLHARWHSGRLAVLLLFAAVVCRADSGATGSGVCASPPAFDYANGASPLTGRMLVLPGVSNTRFPLAPFVNGAEQHLPKFDIEIRRWGSSLLAFRNLRAYERNVEAAAEIAAELAAWRRAHPHRPLYLLGYSGGGGIALLVASALPDDVRVDRLVLVAPAISPDYPLVEDVLPQVNEFVVSYASERDLQVGWGTRIFGTIDRRSVVSAGSVGFAVEHPQLIEWQWSERARELGHRGNHLSYLGRRWQDARLMPALDPELDLPELRAIWAMPCGA